MLDQLWFTSCLKGLRHVAGFQARAASAGLRDVQSHRYASIEKYLRYVCQRAQIQRLLNQQMRHSDWL